MANTTYPQLTEISPHRQEKAVFEGRGIRDRRQDNSAPQRERVAFPQPASRKPNARSRRSGKKSSRIQKRSSKRKTAPVTSWLPTDDKAELIRMAEATDMLANRSLAKFTELPESVSFTDCVVMAVADEYATKDIFGFDKQFADAGYTRLSPSTDWNKAA